MDEDLTACEQCGHVLCLCKTPPELLAFGKILQKALEPVFVKAAEAQCDARQD